MAHFSAPITSLLDVLGGIAVISRCFRGNSPPLHVSNHRSREMFYQDLCPLTVGTVLLTKHARYLDD